MCAGRGDEHLSAGVRVPAAGWDEALGRLTSQCTQERERQQLAEVKAANEEASRAGQAFAAVRQERQATFCAAFEHVAGVIDGIFKGVRALDKLSVFDLAAGAVLESILKTAHAPISSQSLSLQRVLRHAPMDSRQRSRTAPSKPLIVPVPSAAAAACVQALLKVSRICMCHAAAEAGRAGRLAGDLPSTTASEPCSNKCGPHDTTPSPWRRADQGQPGGASEPGACVMHRLQRLICTS